MIPDGWICLPAGTFMMGSPIGEAGRYDNETPHEATITRPFLMQVTEVTQGQWHARLGTTPSYFSDCGSDCPVEQVTWYEAVAYCNALSQAEGMGGCYTDPADGTEYTLADAAAEKVPEWSGPGCRGYRLPTEAEWEYAARAGTITATYIDDLDAEHLVCEQPNAALDGIAWFCGNANGTTHPVATKGANGWGLHDMLGDVWEWCWDRYGDYPADAADDYLGPPVGSPRVARGGSWDRGARRVRAARRYDFAPDGQLYDLGFRPVRSLP